MMRIYKIAAKRLLAAKRFDSGQAQQVLLVMADEEGQNIVGRCLLLNLLAFRQKCDFGDNAQPVLIRYFVL
jgi:hypothetical protein